MNHKRGRKVGQGKRFFGEIPCVKGDIGGGHAGQSLCECDYGNGLGPSKGCLKTTLKKSGRTVHLGSDLETTREKCREGKKGLPSEVGPDCSRQKMDWQQLVSKGQGGSRVSRAHYVLLGHIRKNQNKTKFWMEVKLATSSLEGGNGVAIGEKRSAKGKADTGASLKGLARALGASSVLNRSRTSKCCKCCESKGD